MLSWLKQPLLSVEKIVERLDLVEVMVTNTEIRQVPLLVDPVDPSESP